jgi:glutathione S-transferase
MKLYEFAATRSIRVRWTLQELEVPFEAVSIDLRTGQGQTPDYLRINPTGKVPTLVDGDFVLTESVAIVLYLGEKYPEKRFVPTDPKLRAQLHRWLMFTATELEQPLWRIARNAFLYPEAQRQPSDIEIASREFRKMAAIMESHMQGREFVVGDHVTVGDFVLAHTLDWGNEVKLLTECPALVAYMERMYRRPNAALRIAQALASTAQS